MNAVQMSKLHKLLVWTEKKTDLRNVFFLFLRQDNFSREAFTTHWLLLLSTKWTGTMSKMTNFCKGNENFRPTILISEILDFTNKEEVQANMDDKD